MLLFGKVANAVRQVGVRRHRSWVTLLLFAPCLLPFGPRAADATTFYVRSDGGLAAQCNGLSNTPYPGQGAGLACAWRHPFEALPPGGTARIAGGDTLIIASGGYMMGYGVPGTLQSACFPDYAYDCHMLSVPSGPSSAQPTRILGAGWDVGCPSAPELWGTERASEIISLVGSSNVLVGCLELTDHSSCIEFHCANGQCGSEVNACKRDVPPFGTWGALGIFAKDSNNVTLQDLNIHSLANRGIMAGRISNWNILRSKLKYNGWAGWDSDLGAGEPSSNSGQIYFSKVEIGFNGCAETWPGRQRFGCWAQTSGGYGDGLGTNTTGGNWVVEDSYIHHNTSDGLDLLYANGTGSVTVRRTRAEGNAGNQLKTNGNATIENSVVVGNCAYFSGIGNMQQDDQCRAVGNAVSLGLVAGSDVTLRYNTITGQGDCLILNGGGSASSHVYIQNNALIGAADYWAGIHGNPPEQACAQYSDNSAAAITFTGNLFWAVKDSFCPAGSLCGQEPKLGNISLTSFDPTPLPGSPLIDHANASVTISTDQRGFPRPIGAGNDIGAVENQGPGEGRIFMSRFGDEDPIFANGFGG